MRLLSLLLALPRTRGEQNTIFGRIVLAYLWLGADVPRWSALLQGHLTTNSVAAYLFGKDIGLPVTYFVTVLETLGSATLILGLLTRLAALWGVIEFAITGATGWVSSQGSFDLLKDFGLMSTSLTLLLNGSSHLSLDRLIAKRKGLPVIPHSGDKIFGIFPNITTYVHQVIALLKRLTHTKLRKR